MNLTAKAKDLARYLSRIESRLLNLNPNDVQKRYQLFSIAMNKCTHFEHKLGTTGISLIDIIERNRLSTGEELYTYLYSELPIDLNGKHEVSDVIRDAARQISEIKDAQVIYREKSTGDVVPATNHDIQVGFDRLIKACYTAAAQGSIK